ncbi:MAG: hypothetical protein QOG64_417 [Acidimicrobiaceae bacterium]|nr:hypothetical protein [Acidimicrobiaceae bacterium]
MSGPFACIGIDVEAAGGLEDALTPLMAAAGEHVYPGGGSLFEWRDPSGAGVIITTVTVDNVVRCVTPVFTAHTTIDAVATGFAAGGHCSFCDPLLLDLVDTDGRPRHALAIRLEDSAMTRRRVVPGQPLTVAVAGFAEELRVGPPVDGGASDRRASVPIGLFRTPPLPQLLLTATVVATDERSNEHTGLPFRWALVESLGQRYEIVARPTPLAVGDTIQGLFWLIGRVVGGLADRPLRGRALRRSQASRASGH